MRSKRFKFPGGQGVQLAARLDKPDGTPRAYALFAHCFTCSKDILGATRIAETLTQHGIGVLRFDFTGLGSSEGEFANTNFSSNVADLVAAADQLRQQAEPPRLLIGHSLGGTAVLAAAASIAEVVGVATIGSPFEPAGLVRHFKDELPTIEAEGAAAVKLGGRTFTVKKQFLDDIKDHDMTQHIAELRRSLLVLHAPMDETVSIDSATRIFSAAKHPKSFVSLDRADHLLTRREDAEYAAGMIAAWAANRIGAGTMDAAEAPKAEPGAVLVEETRRGRFQQVISAAGHTLTADEPVSVGGDDTGPGPYDLLLGGLGACTAMTMRMYAERKGWPLEKARVVLRHERNWIDDCEACETKDAKIERITRTITVTGDLSDEQRAKLLEIADKCPVHRTLRGPLKVVTEDGA